MSEAPVFVRSEAAGLRLIRQHMIESRQRSAFCANGLMDAVPGQRFTILLSNFTRAPQQLPKHTLIAWAAPAPDYHVPLDMPLSTNVPDEAIATIRNDELRLTKRRSACIESHATQSKKKATDDDKDWHDTVQIGSAFEDRLPEVLLVLEPFHKMWDGHLGLMAYAAHAIDLVPEATPFRSVSYRAGIRMTDIEKAEVDKMVEQGVAVPALPTDWAAPVVFAQK